MNKYLFKIEDVVNSASSFNGYIFKCQIDPKREESIQRLAATNQISIKEKSLLIHFFKTQRATEKLLDIARKGFAFENDILLDTNLSILKKKKRIGMLIILLNNITSAINMYAEMGLKDDDAQFDSIKSKLNKYSALNTKRFPFCKKSIIDITECKLQIRFIKFQHSSRCPIR